MTIPSAPVAAKSLYQAPADQRGSASMDPLRVRKLAAGGRTRGGVVLAGVRAVALATLAVLAVLVLYLVKSALGIDLVPGFSLGVWGWFKGAFLSL